MILVLQLINAAVAQDTIAIFKRPNSFLIGLSSGTRPAYFDSDNNYIFQLGGSARIGYFPISRLAVIAEYSKYALVGNIINTRTAFNSRIVGRYYWQGVRSGVYTDLGYMISDSRIYKGDSINTTKFPSHYLDVVGGFSIKISKNLYFDFSQHVNISLNGKNTKTLLGFDTHIGVDYIFNNKYADIPKRKRVKMGESEDLGKRKFQVATGVFFFPFTEDDFGERYNELLWTSKFGYYLTKNITFGLTTGLIYGKPKIQDDRFFYFVGPYINYKIIPHEKISMYLETGYNYSNHSIPEVGLPRNSTTHYLNYGCGVNYKINNDLYIDAGIVLQGCVGGTKKCEGGGAIWRLGTEFVIR